MKLSGLKSKIDEFFDNLSEEDIERIKQKYFPECNIPKGWVNIEEHLPKFKAVDTILGYSEYKVKNVEGEEGISYITDHNIWANEARASGITHWYNE